MNNPTDEELNAELARLFGVTGQAPDFANDLNVCAKMESTLATEEQQQTYIAHLDDGEERAPFRLVTAPARERSLAFLRTWATLRPPPAPSERGP